MGLAGFGGVEVFGAELVGLGLLQRGSDVIEDKPTGNNGRIFGCRMKREEWLQGIGLQDLVFISSRSNNTERRQAPGSGAELPIRVPQRAKGAMTPHLAQLSCSRSPPAAVGQPCRWF